MKTNSRKGKNKWAHPFRVDNKTSKDLCRGFKDLRFEKGLVEKSSQLKFPVSFNVCSTKWGLRNFIYSLGVLNWFCPGKIMIPHVFHSFTINNFYFCFHRKPIFFQIKSFFSVSFNVKHKGGILSKGRLKFIVQHLATGQNLHRLRQGFLSLIIIEKVAMAINYMNSRFSRYNSDLGDHCSYSSPSLHSNLKIFFLVKI